MRETVAFETGTTMRIWAYVRRSRRSLSTKRSSLAGVRRGWCRGTQEREKSRTPSPSSFARWTQRRAVFSQTIRAAAAARMVCEWRSTSRAISARVSGVRRALPCMLSVRLGGWFVVYPPPSRHVLAVRTTCCNKTPNQALQPTRMLVTFHAYAWPAPSTRVAVMRTI